MIGYQHQFLLFATAWYVSGALIKPRFLDPRDKPTLRR